MNDEKMAKDYNIEGGSVLHLVRLQYILAAAVIYFWPHADSYFASGASIARGQVGAGRIFTTYALSSLPGLAHLFSLLVSTAGSLFLRLWAWLPCSWLHRINDYCQYICGKAADHRPCTADYSSPDINVNAQPT